MTPSYKSNWLTYDATGMSVEFGDALEEAARDTVENRYLSINRYEDDDEQKFLQIGVKKQASFNEF
jgi:hypothetical protein